MRKTVTGTTFLMKTGDHRSNVKYSKLKACAWDRLQSLIGLSLSHFKNLLITSLRTTCFDKEGISLTCKAAMHTPL